MSDKTFELIVPVDTDFNLLALLQKQWPEQVNAHDVVTGFVIVVDSETERREHAATHAHGNLGELSVVWPGVHARVNPRTGQARVFLNHFQGMQVGMRVTLSPALTGHNWIGSVPLNKRFNAIALACGSDSWPLETVIGSVTAKVGEKTLTFSPIRGRPTTLQADVEGQELGGTIEIDTGHGYISWPNREHSTAELTVSLISRPWR